MKSLLYVGLIFILALALVFHLLHYIEREQRRMFPHQALALPTALTLEALQSTETSLRLVFVHQYYCALLCFSLMYLIKQTFAIPGSLLLNLMAGWLLPFPTALVLTVALTTVGASCCYGLSRAFGDEAALVGFANRWTKPGTLAKLRKTLAGQSTFLKLVGVRVFPMSPNWLLNLLSPWMHIPLYRFAASVALGLLPYVVLTVSAGRRLGTMTSSSEALDANTFGVLVGLSGLVWLVSQKLMTRSSGDKRVYT